MNYQLILVPLPTLVELNKMVDIDEEKSKKFLSAMDSTLSTFQSINEWPDFISFLGKLSKVLFLLLTLLVDYINIFKPKVSLSKVTSYKTSCSMP